jgi:hypothetical protein
MKNARRIFPGAGLVVVGVTIITAALLTPPLPWQLLAGLAGAGLLLVGIIVLQRKGEEDGLKRKLGALSEELETIRKEMEKLEAPEKKGVAIADVISSSLKYYADHMTEKKREE